VVSEPSFDHTSGEARDATWSFQVLGEVQARHAGVVLPMGGVKARSVLAMLALDAGRVVPTTRLITGLWGEDAPATANATLQVHVANLRKALAVTSSVDTPPSPVHTRAGGYVLDVLPSCVDLHRFRAAVDDARRVGDGRSRSEQLRSALGPWHGEALVGLESEPFAGPVITSLTEEWLAAVESRIHCDLDTGADASLVGELRELTAAHPLRERFWAQLMLALYRCGRQADALAAYREVRDHLIEELGLEPGRELRELEDDILQQAASLLWSAGPVAPARGSRTTIVQRSSASVRAATLTWSNGKVVIAEQCTLGRELDNHVAVEDPEASRHHGVIRRTSEGFLYVDQHSTNGSFVNGEAVGERVLCDGDIIRIGRTEFVFAEETIVLGAPASAT